MGNREDIALLAPKGTTGVELGVAKGALTKCILDLKHFSEFHAVDRWSDHHSILERDHVIETLKDYEELTVWHVEVKQWLKTIPDGSLGFVYIDCYAHTGQEDGAILEAAWPKLQDGGLFSGDDYDECWPTYEVVQRFAESVGREVNVWNDFHHNNPYDNHDSWYFHR